MQIAEDYTSTCKRVKVAKSQALTIQTVHCMNIKYIQGGPKKVSHYRVSSLNRIKNRQPGYIVSPILIIK